ncbi:MAG: cellulase family glycosylhydrolase [Solirubrobacterales bacterium]|nr:cellulase family glycosylhydrolase [Solirubrobacterales bacterium]
MMRRGCALVAAVAAVFLLFSTAAEAAGNKVPVPQVIHAADRAYISDGQGREMLLRGINSNSLIEYPDNFQQTIPFTRDDAREMAALGFNFLRLPINWSRLEPEPDQFSESYLDEIDRIVTWAEAEGLSVLVDFHQDRYNKHLRPPDEADGAPDWATETDGQPCTFGAFFTSPCSVAALDHFWNNDVIAGKPLQTHYLEAMTRVSAGLASHKGLLGLEIMNEPTPGSTNSPNFERQQLWPFYERMISGLRGQGEKRMIWFEPNMLRDVTDFDLGQPEKFSDDGNLVYAPHIYTGTFNGGGPDQLRTSYEKAVAEAKAYGAPFVDGEWGGGSDEKAESMRALKLELQNEHRVGGAFWMWKQKSGFYNWHTVNEDGSLRDDSMRAQMLSQPHADRIPGQIVSTGFADGKLTTVASGKGGTARLWSGTIVYKGGASLIAQPLIRAFVDGKRVKATLLPKVFKTDKVNIRGFRVQVKVPKGKHSVELRAGKPVWVKPKRIRGHWKKIRGRNGKVRKRWVKGRTIPGYWK